MRLSEFYIMLIFSLPISYHLWIRILANFQICINYKQWIQIQLVYCISSLTEAYNNRFCNFIHPWYTYRHRSNTWDFLVLELFRNPTTQHFLEGGGAPDAWHQKENICSTRISGPYGPFEILAPAGSLLLSSHKARGGDVQGNKTNTLTKY